uniref:Ricin B lectin domain-containing protein n=1 Tax=Lotharella globosa TaxID=91324 RepID=A0A7S3YVG9_9EUKA
MRIGTSSLQSLMRMCPAPPGRMTNTYLWILLLTLGLTVGLCVLGVRVQKVMTQQATGKYSSPEQRVAAWRDFLRENDLYAAEIVGHANSGTPRCLDIKGAAKVEGENLGGRHLQALNCTGGANQRWSLQRDESIRSKRNKEYCLSINQASKDAQMTRCSEQFTRWKHNTDTNQILTVDSSPPFCLEMKNEDGGFVKAGSCVEGDEGQAFMLL